MGILTGLDDIQQLLDDHILKSQTMRGSPYVKAFEADMIAWEEKLISMQDILDQWLTVSVWVKRDILLTKLSKYFTFDQYGTFEIQTTRNIIPIYIHTYK